MYMYRWTCSKALELLVLIGTQCTFEVPRQNLTPQNLSTHNFCLNLLKSKATVNLILLNIIFFFNEIGHLPNYSFKINVSKRNIFMSCTSRSPHCTSTCSRKNKRGKNCTCITIIGLLQGQFVQQTQTKLDI